MQIPSASLVAIGAAVILAYPASAPGQERVGVLAGGQFGWLGGQDVYETHPELGFRVGGFGEWQLSPSLGVRPELIYVERRWQAQIHLKVSEAEYSARYIQLPLLFLVRHPSEPAPQFTVGPVLSLGVHDNQLGNEDTANILLGFQAGVGFAIPFHGWGLGVEGRYIHDLRPLGEADRSYRGLAVSLMVTRRRGS